MDPNKIGRFIYELRTEQSLSQYKLADMIPISRQAVSKWERGQTIPDSSTLIRLSEIFNVTINELLSGEHLTNDTIENLENTTLTILDEHNRRVREVKKLLFVFSSIIALLLLAFLTCYFVNSYKSIQVYKVYAKGELFDLYDGLLITTKQKSYFKLGNISGIEENTNIQKVEVYYYENNQRKILFEDSNADRIITDIYGYFESSIGKSLNELLTTSYIEVTYTENKKEIVKLNYKRDFINNDLFFLSNKHIKETQYSNRDFVIDDEKIADKLEEKLVESGNKYDEAYSIIIYDQNDIIKFTYIPNLKEIALMKDDILIWHYFLESKTCLYVEKNQVGNECIRKIVKDYKRYLENYE